MVPPIIQPRIRSARFGHWALLPACLVVASPLCGEPVVNPSPAPPVQLPPYDVSAPRELGPNIDSGIEKLNHLFDGPFPSLRSGALIEAILWRHRYLGEHPEEKAVIITTEKGERIRSATTVYTRGGKVFASSNALGENQRIPGLVAADLNSPDGLARAKKFIVDTRQSYAGAKFNPSNEAAFGDAEVPTATLGSLMVRAEETGDYRILAMLAGQPTTFDKGSDPFAVPGAQRARNFGNNLLKMGMVQAFAEPSSEILSWTYQALRSPKRAGIVPVAISWIDVNGSTVTISPIGRSTDRAGVLQPLDIPSDKKHPLRHLEALVFDWDGVQYLYQPDVGTQAKPLPVNPLTGLPYLCIRNGALMECAYFCATYAKNHPGEKAVLLADAPSLAAYQAGEKLGLFIPALGRFTLPKEYLDAIGDPAALTQLRDQLIAMQTQQKAKADVIPEKIAGDDADMQIRRAYLAFQAGGIPCHLVEEGGAPSLDFTWDGVTYVYGSDQQVRPAAGG